MFHGSIPALITPFRNGTFDEAAFRDFVEWQIAEGSAALVPVGTTGEAATLTKDEHFEVVRVCADQVRGRVPVIAGAGSNDTRVAIGNVQAAKAAGADAVLMVPPYYNRPSQEGIFRHFEAVAAQCELPIVLYNVPGRTVTDIQPETVIRIVQAFPGRFVAIKDATGDLARVSTHRAALRSELAQLSGNDDLALAFNAMGGVGCISVTANVAPRLCAQFQAACAEGDMVLALALHDRLFALHAALFSDASPGPVKYAVNRLRPEISTELRLPMVEPAAASKAAVDAAMAVAGLI
ncbi:4-hydroxy-tetrahydrodipicolinate synthase [Sphingomonas sp.]|uniref:4-hydroxy-tetrahydrodipicolinate synthase n=1 Tax=Sphingomonas sp. TaxID=28214 RepID=UPI001ED2F43A|nr:4-hydroxy-tetrahydrodipicolinate synthase [Sphingomonas sp.]MBX3595157.1 4-hydroxy-tetrahydrodipicolinate synthase [Sphingomonas sp.]